MAEVYPLKEIPRNDGGCSIVEFTNDDYFSASTLPIALPMVWDEIPVGQSITERTQVFSSNELYICIDRHNKGSIRPESDLSNWIRPARSVERIVNSDGTTTVTNSEGFVGLRFNFVANGTVTTGTTVTDTNGLGTITHNLNTSGFGGGGTTVPVTSDNTLDGDGLAANPLAVADFFKKFSLFFGTPGTATAVTLDSIVTSFTSYTTANVPYYFIQGVEINGSGDGFVAGQGVWTESLPTGTIDFANTFNLIG